VERFGRQLQTFNYTEQDLFGRFAVTVVRKKFSSNTDAHLEQLHGSGSVVDRCRQHVLYGENTTRPWRFPLDNACPGNDRGVAIFAKAFMGIPAQQAAKAT